MEKASKSLRQAIRKGNVIKVTKLVDNVKQGHIKDIVPYAVEVGSYEVLEALPRTWYHHSFDSPLLIIAVRRGHDGICRFLLGQGLCANEMDEESGYTPLYVACLTKNINIVIVKLLLEFGADPEIRTHTEQSVIKLLDRKQRLDIIAMVRETQSSGSGSFKLAGQVDELQEKVYNLGNDMCAINEKLSRLDHLATKDDVQQMATGTYVQFGRSISLDNVKQCQRNPIGSKRDKENVYSYLACDFLEANGNPKRSFSPEERQHIKSKLTFVINKLGCQDMIMDIADRMFQSDSLTIQQMEMIKNHKTAKDNARFLMINVVLQGGRLHLFHGFVNALKDLKEDSMVKVLLTADVEHTKL